MNTITPEAAIREYHRIKHIPKKNRTSLQNFICMWATYFIEQRKELNHIEASSVIHFPDYESPLK